MLNKHSVIVLFIVLCAFVFACSTEAEKEAGDNTEVTATRVPGEGELRERGEFLVTVGGCNDCHTPKVFSREGMRLDSSRLYAGHRAGSALPAVIGTALQPGQWALMSPDATAFVGPWGISYAANLTPDSATGIGAWSEEAFIKTFRTGRHLGLENGRPILPPMPWYNLARLEEQDLKAMYAYLRSIPAVDNRVPAPVPPNSVQTAGK